VQLTVGGQIEAISPEGSTMASELWNFVDSFSEYKMGAVHMSSMYNMIKKLCATAAIIHACSVCVQGTEHGLAKACLWRVVLASTSSTCV